MNDLKIAQQIIYKGQDLCITFPKLDDALEILFVLNGIKPVARQMIHEEDFFRVAGFCDANGLKYSVSNFKILPEKQLMVKTDHPKAGHYFAYISYDKDLAEKAKFYEHIRNDEKLGLALGYPKCCVSFYKENYQKALKLRDDYSLMAIENSSANPNFLTNNMLRFFGTTLLSHFPCSFDCGHSMLLANDMLKCVSRHNPLIADYLKDVLKGPVISHAQTGIHTLKGYKIDGKDIYYKDAWLTSPNHMHDLLKLGNKIEMIGKNHIRICQDDHVMHEEKGEHVGMVVFE